MLVDTGAERTMVTEETAERLKMTRDTRFVTRSGGVGGVTQSADARVGSFVLGDFAVPIDRVSVNRLGPGVPFEGILGADILLASDLDIDVPGGALSLYRTRSCIADDPPWPDRAVPILGVTARRNRMMVPIEVNGVEGTALLDTGAQTSTLSASFARRLGLTDQVLASGQPLTIRGVGPGTLQARMHRFRTVRLGPVVGTNVLLPVMPMDIGFGDALIGGGCGCHSRRGGCSSPSMGTRCCSGRDQAAGTLIFVSRARESSGIATGRCDPRSTKTCTKWPSAAAESSSLRNTASS
jgi:hypothetical protein